MRTKIIILIVFISFFLVSFISAVESSIHLNIQTTNSTGGIIVGTYNFDFNITTSEDCSGVVYNYSFPTTTTDSEGKVNFYLNNISFGNTQNWLCYYRDGTLKNASKISYVPHSFYANTSNNWDDYNTANSTQIGNSGGVLNILESWLNTFVNTVVNTLLWTTNFNNTGDERWLDDTNLGFFINYTLTKTTGNITNGTLNGYLAGNIICQIEVDSESHMCSMGEILNMMMYNKSNANFTATFRANEGAPGYLADVSDCAGLTSQSSTALGSIWVGDTSHLNTYGAGGLVGCNMERAIGCCG